VKRSDGYTYEQFLSSNLDDMERMANTKGRPRADALWKDENNKVRDKYGSIVT